MSKELRKVFETFLKEFKGVYNRKILLIISDLKYHASGLYHANTPHYKGYKKALKDMEQIIKRMK